MPQPPITDTGSFLNRLAIERKRPVLPSLVPSYGGGATEASVIALRRAEKRMKGFLNRRTLETALISNPELAKLSTELLAERFEVCALTAHRVRIALEKRRLIPKTATRICRDGTERDTRRIGAKTDVSK